MLCLVGNNSCLFFLLTGLALELVGKEGGLFIWGFRFLEGVFLFCSV
jgi:hypothetical protein